MHHEFNSISQVGSSYGNVSHISVLRPREDTITGSAPSDIHSMFKSFLLYERETWFHRLKLAFRILTFCLGPANIWRFPEQSFVFGNASYVYLYLIYISLFCTSLLVFELSLSQYFFKGFAKILTLCPAMEGITLAMVFYCIMANLVYNVIMVYSLIYAFTALSKKMSHSYCSERLKEHGCQEKANLTQTPEHIYLNMFVEKLIEVSGGNQYNWRNAAVLLIIYIFICLILIFGLFENHWIPIVVGTSIFVILLYLAFISALTDGATKGLSRMFIPRKSDFGELRTWVYSFEQSIATIGVGTGPLTTFWFISKIKYWSRFECMIINVFVVFCSLLAGMIYFSAAGVSAHQNNSTIDDIMVASRKEMGTFVFVTKMFNSMPSGVGNFTLFLYYLMLFCSCLYSMLEYTQIILLYISSYINNKRYGRKIIILVCCALYIFITNIDLTKIGFPLMLATNECFIGTALLIILFFEFSSVSYFYGMTTFCDDIEFTLSYLPSCYFKYTWYSLPLLFFFFSLASIVLKFQRAKSGYETAVLLLTMVLTLVPILGFAAYKYVVKIREVGVRRFFNPRLNEDDEGSSRNR